MNRIANIEMRDVDRDDIGQIARQAFDLERAQRLFEQAAKRFHTFRCAGRFERYVSLDHFVHRNSVEIHMQNIATERSVLHFLDKGETSGLLAINLEFDENVLAGGVAEHERNIAPGDL